jgi:Mycoplasma protein of unknown function, DUF285
MQRGRCRSFYANLQPDRLTKTHPPFKHSMKSMFEEASKFSQDLSHFDTSSVVNFKRMFAYAFVFDQDISMWDVGSAESMQSMFEGSGFDHSLCTWGNALESSVDVEGMFAGSGCRNMTDPDLLQTPPGPFCYRCRPICKSVSACTNLLWYKCQTPTSDRCKTTSSCFNNALEECCPGASVPTKSYKAQVLTKYKDQRCRWCTKDAVCAAQPQVTACLSNNCTANATCFASGVSKACCHGFKAPAAFLNLTRVIARKSCLDKSVCTPPRRPIRVCAAKVRRSCNTCDSTRLEPCLQNVIARPVNTKEGCCLPGGQEEKTKNVEKVLIVHNALYCE